MPGKIFSRKIRKLKGTKHCGLKKTCVFATHTLVYRFTFLHYTIFVDGLYRNGI